MRSHITRKSAPEIIRLLDYCYKRGVVDASEVEDDLAVQDWYDETIDSGKYGLVGSPDEECDWKRWRFFLLRWCRENRLSSLGFDYIDGVRRARGFEFLIIPMAMRFYLFGVKEWLDYPNPSLIGMFKAKPKFRWSPSVPQQMKNMTKDDFISLIQEFIYELRNKPMEGMKDVAPRAMDNFEYAMWQMTRSTRVKIR